ncbi:hypothetical protein HWV07_10320 [Natronomonas salina]|uniref:hypothetical protein n=1 Tax=Natronomonas salina TaxID=1710540 RepID=UPI0015B65405|nr:hypothetical protein [Natronomonas salina]QLD89402.1 hypothetical protein HWV07_10320 [Natronomonas salina]
MEPPSPGSLSRRDALKLAGGAGVLGVGAVAGDRLLAGEDAPTTSVEDDRARELAEAFAPDVYYDEYEEWYVTDPRPYETDRDGEVVVDGKAAYDGYSRDFDEGGEPPRRVVFYHVQRYEDSPLAVVQYWLYSAFDQFTTNFHWHDWELLQVFVDLETEEPQLYVASAHSRSVPNNEFLDPDPDRRPAILPELGSHSSALAVNELRDSFQRFPLEDDVADITNGALEALGDLPMAYGLPRDEGFALPFVIPELDGRPIYEHPDLPNVTRDHLVDPALTVRSYDGLAEPPAGLPERGTGLQFGVHGDADYSYELEPVSELTHVDAFVGPQLSFEFDVPRFAEDAVAGHITATETPWKQERFEDPAADVTDPAHRSELADRYDAVDPGGPLTQVVGRLRRVEPDEDAPDDNGVKTTDTSTGGVALVESDPVAVPSFGGVVVAQGLEEGEHRLTVNAPGMAPYSERVAATDGETTAAGADGDLALVDNRDAVKLAVDGESGDSLAQLAVEDDFGGRIVDREPAGSKSEPAGSEKESAGSDDADDRLGVYLHRGGAYTVEVRDPDDEPGAHRFNPGDESRHEVVARTGKASLASFVATIVTETGQQAPGFAGGETGGGGDGGGGSDEDALDGGIVTDVADPALRGLLQALASIATAAERAAERAESGDAGGADNALRTVRERIRSARADLEAEDHDDDVESVTARRLEQAERRAEQALETGKPN